MISSRFLRGLWMAMTHPRVDDRLIMAYEPRRDRREARRAYAASSTKRKRGGAYVQGPALLSSC